MHQNPLRILCAYYDPEPDWLGESPEDALEGHDITVAHSYRDAKGYIIDPQRGVPSFDIVLADIALPGGFNTDHDSVDVLFPAILLETYVKQALVRGLGIFVPEHYESVFNQSDGYLAVSASKECWTLTHKRDWLKLLELVIKTSG